MSPISPTGLRIELLMKCARTDHGHYILLAIACNLVKRYTCNIYQSYIGHMHARTKQQPTSFDMTIIANNIIASIATNVYLQLPVHVYTLKLSHTKESHYSTANDSTAQGFAAATPPLTDEQGCPPLQHHCWPCFYYKCPRHNEFPPSCYIECHSSLQEYTWVIRVSLWKLCYFQIGLI